MTTSVGGLLYVPPPGDPQVQPQVPRPHPGAGGRAAAGLQQAVIVTQLQEPQHTRLQTPRGFTGVPPPGGTRAEGVLVGPVAVGGGEDVARGDQHAAAVGEHRAVCRARG